MLAKRKIIFFVFLNLVTLFLIYSYIYNGKNFSYIDPDDNLHLLLKSKTITNCINQNCEGLNFFASELNYKININKSIEISNLSSRQFQRTISSYHPLPSIYVSFLNYITNDYSLSFKIFLITNILLINFSLLYFCRDYIPSKYLYFFLIFIFLALNTTMLSSYMYAHSTSFAFFLISLNKIFNKNLILGVLFSILSILSHSIGIAYSLIFLICYIANSEKFFSTKKNIFYISFVLLVSFFYYFNLSLATTKISNDNIFNLFIENYSTFELIKYKLYELKKHLEAVPVFSSFGIYFIALLVLYGFTNNEKIIKNQKNLFILSIALTIIIFVSLFSNSTLLILKRLQPIIMLIIYIAVFCVFINSCKIFFNFLKKTKLKKLNFNRFNRNKFELFKFSSSIIFFIFFIIFLRIEFLKPHGIKYIKYMKNLDDSNYENINFNSLKNSLKENNTFLIDGTEANLYFHILNGLYNYKFYWSHIYSSDEKKDIINEVDYLIIDNNISFSGRNIDSVHQYNNQLFIDKDFILVFEDIDAKHLVLSLTSSHKNILLVQNNKNKKEYKIKKGKNEIKINSENLKKISISSKQKLLISTIKLKENQETNWPWNSKLKIKKLDLNPSANKEIDFKLNNRLKKNFDCSNFELLNDDELFVYLKVNC